MEVSPSWEAANSAATQMSLDKTITTPHNHLHIYIIIIIIIIIIMVLQPFVGPWPLFQFSDPIHSR
jgi:t-SNARE complex subunit (syntaxin)